MSSGAGVDRPISQVNVCNVYSDVVVVVAVVFVPTHVHNIIIIHSIIMYNIRHCV